MGYYLRTLDKESIWFIIRLYFVEKKKKTLLYSALYVKHYTRNLTVCYFYAPFRNGFREVICQPRWWSREQPCCGAESVPCGAQRQWPGAVRSPVRGAQLLGTEGPWGGPLLTACALELLLSSGPGCTAVEMLSCFLFLHLSLK